MGIPPLKHVLDDLFSIAAATSSVQIVTLAVGTINPNYYSNNNNVRNGSKITKINLLLDFTPYATVPTDADVQMQYDWYVAFNINGAQVLPNPNAVGSSSLQSQVFHQDQGTFNFNGSNTNSMPSHVVRLTIDVPRTWQQLNENDTIEFRIQKSVMATQQLGVKLKCIYKEIFP